MLVVKGLLFLIWFLLSPYLIGYLFREKVMNQQQPSPGHSLVTGYMLLFALFYLFTMPLLLLGASLRTLTYIYASTNVLLSAISLVRYTTAIRQTLIHHMKQLRQIRIIMVIAILMIVFQTGLLTLYQHIDDDDAFYVATSTTAVVTDTIVAYDPYTGLELKSYHMRYVMSPFPVYTAVMSKLLMIHPTIVAHTVFPLIFIPLAYVIAYLLIVRFFNGKHEHAAYALLFLSLLTLMGHVSIYTSSTFLLFRIWQGKAMLANIILPAILLYASDIMAGSHSKQYWILVAVTVLAGCLVSSMSVVLVPLMLGLLAIIFSFRNRSIAPILMSIVCLIPCIICGVFYIL